MWAALLRTHASFVPQFDAELKATTGLPLAWYDVLLELHASGGATSTGAFHEGINLAAIEKLPLVIVVANNQFAYSTPTTRQFACSDLIEKARGYGIGGFSVDGTDLLACASVIGEAVRRARCGSGPQMVVAHLLRLSGHGEHDDGSYVPNDTRNDHYGRDCIEVAMRQLVEHDCATPEEISAWQDEFAGEVQRAVAQAQQEDVPDPYLENWTALATQFPLADPISQLIAQ